MQWRRVIRVTATVLTALVVTVAVGAVGIAGVRGEIYTPRDAIAPPVSVDAAAIPTHDPTKPTAVVVLSLAGTNVADALPPYEVLASTGAFNLYTVAEQRQPMPLTGGVDLIPDLTFGQLADRLQAAPDVIVVPEIHDRGEPSSAPIEEWLQRQRRVGDPLLVGICVGAEVLAHPGLLDGRPATAHWLGLIGFRREYPAVHWQDGVRYVDDGDVITAAGVLSGVDAALRVVERMIGPAAAEQAARAVEWPDYSPGGAAPIPRYRPAAPDVVGLLSAAYRWNRPNMGVLLTDGVGEIELASAFRPYTVFSYLAQPVAVTADGHPIRSRHGLTFVPRADLASATPGVGPVGGSRHRRGRTRPRGRATAARAAESDLPAYSARFRLRRCAARHRAYLGRRDGALGGQNVAVSQHECAAIRPGLAMEPHPAPHLDCRGGDRSDREHPAPASRTEATGGEKIMTTLTTVRGQALRRFLRHYLEMIMAMVVGMVVLGAAEAMLFNRVAWAETVARPESDVLIMATNMIIPMATWMRVRGHRWGAIAEMAVAMYLPFVALFVPLWLGVLSPTGLMVLGHVLMLFAMAAVMWRRRDEYANYHHRKAQS